MASKASIRRILKNDHRSLFMLIVVGIVLVVVIPGVVLLLLPTLPSGDTSGVDSTKIALVLAITATLVFGWLASRRITSIKRIIRSGPEVEGRIQIAQFAKDRGRVEYEYEYNGRSYHAGADVWKNRETTCLKSGDRIAIIVDPQEPSRALIASLYT